MDGDTDTFRDDGTAQLFYAERALSRVCNILLYLDFFFYWVEPVHTCQVHRDSIREVCPKYKSEQQQSGMIYFYMHFQFSYNRVGAELFRSNY